MNLSFFSGGAAWRQEGKGDPLNEVRPVRGHVFLVFIFWFDEEHFGSERSSDSSWLLSGAFLFLTGLKGPACFRSGRPPNKKTISLITG